MSAGKCRICGAAPVLKDGKRYGTTWYWYECSDKKCNQQYDSGFECRTVGEAAKSWNEDTRHKR